MFYIRYNQKEKNILKIKQNGYCHFFVTFIYYYKKLKRKEVKRYAEVINGNGGDYGNGDGGRGGKCGVVGD